MQRRTIGLGCIIAVFITAAGLCREADEEKEDLPWEKGAIQFGGFVAFFQSDVTFGIQGRRSETLGGENLLGLDSSLAVFRVDAMIRPGTSRRHQVDFTYASYDRDGSAILGRELTLGEETFPIGAQIESTLDFDLIRGTYTYAIVQSRRVRIGLGLGMYAIPLSYSLDVQTTTGFSGVEGADTTVPLPVLAVRSEFLLVQKLFLKLAADGMHLEINDFEGTMIDINAGLEYRPWKHFGFGLAYNFVGANVTGEDASSDYPGIDFVGEVDVRFSGLLLYGKLAF